jgi:hypothetical protein
MKSRSNVDLQDTAVSLNTNFLPPPLALDFGGETPAHQETLATSFSDLPGTTSEDGSASPSANAGEGSAASSFALLDTQPEAGHPGMDSAPASIIDISPGSGSINVIGTAIQEANAGPGFGLHIAPPVDSDFTTEALFAPAASVPAPVVSINLANLTPISFEGHGVEAVANNPGVDTALAHPAAQASLDAGSETGTFAAGAAGLAYLDNSRGGSPVTNSGVGSGGATAAQVQQALDESGLSVNGSGIKIGVLSDSFNNLNGAAADEADGALPSTVQVLKDDPSGSGTDEGRAMMQIIHEIAPGASLAFYTADVSEQDFANGILALAAAGAKVIVDDVGYFDEPFFQNGVAAQAIQTVEAEGVTYVTAAGNEGSNGYQASFTAGSGTFDGQTLTNAENFGGSLTQTVTINSEGTGEKVPLVLEWNQAYGAVSSSTADLKILIFQNGSLVGTLTDASDGEATNPWIEANLPSGTYQIAIENTSSSSTDAGLIFKEITWGDGFPATISGSNTGTVVGHSMTPGAITAGAVYVGQTPAFGFNPAISESFSSSGAGTVLLFANNGTALSSPDLLNPVAVSGVDGIATSVSGGLGDFFGTSASSASLAGVAALILSADPNLTPAQVEELMEQTALGMGNSAIAGAGLVQVDPAVAEALAFVTTVIQTDGTTALTKVSTNYFMNNTGTGIGPELHYGGAAVVAGEFGTYTPIGAVQVSSGDYDIAWHDPSSGLYSVWSVDSNGNYLSNLTALIAGNSATLESFETIFGQDLNNDGSIGPPPPPPPVTIQIDGTTKLAQAGSNYYLYNTSTNTGPELHYGGAAVVAGEFGAYTPIGAVQVSGGDYDIAWHDPSSGLYSVWSVDSGGNYLSNLTAPIAGNSTTLESFETIFGQDLNGDGHIGAPPPPPPTVIQTDGTTALTEVGTNYFLNSTGGGTGPELKFGGSAIIAGQFGSSITPIGAVQVSGGDYDIAWHDTSSGLYSVWSVDSSGNYLSNLATSVTGNSSTLESFETIFGQDLNGDGHIGAPPPPPPTVIQTDGTTALTEVGTNYFLNPTGGGTGPELKFGGSTIIAGQFGSSVTPIGAVQVSGGDYDIAWHDTSSGLYSVWSVDSNGNYLSNLATSVAGNSSTLESFETIFGQDLNGDGTIGNSTTGQTVSNSAAVSPSANSTPDNFHFASDGSGSRQAIAFSVHPNNAAGQTGTTPNVAMATAGHDGFVFASDHGPASAENFVHPMNFVPSNNAALTDSHATPTGAHEDVFSSAIHDAAHGAQWLVHHSDFHFI